MLAAAQFKQQHEGPGPAAICHTQPPNSTRRGPTRPPRPSEPQPLRAGPPDVPPRVSTEHLCLRCVHTRPTARCSGKDGTGSRKFEKACAGTAGFMS